MQINYEALTKKVTNIEIANFKKQNKDTILNLIMKLGIFLLVGFIIVFLMFAFAQKICISGESCSQYYFLYSMFVVIIIAIILVAYRFGRIKKIQLANFAKANNFEYIESIASPAEDGMIFNVGSSHKSYDILKAKTGNIFEIGNHQYEVGDSEHRNTIKRGYIKVCLNRNLPHMVLDSKKNNVNIFGLSLSNLPVAFKNDQVLSLEGDFDKYFTLYAPKDYERDALYVFTPDLMALFIDESSSFDAEIIDDCLYIYSSKPFNLFDQSLLGRLFQIIDKVASKTLSQTKNYADERTGNRAANIVTKPGQRLKKGFPWIPVAIFIILILIQLLFNYLL